MQSGHVHKTSEIGTLIDTKCRPLAILQGQLAFSQWRSLVSPRSERTTSHGAGGNSRTTPNKVRASTSSTTNELDRVEASTRAQGVPNPDSFFQICFGFLPYIYQTVASSKELLLLLIAFKHTSFNFLQFQNHPITADQPNKCLCVQTKQLFHRTIGTKNEQQPIKTHQPRLAPNHNAPTTLFTAARRDAHFQTTHLAKTTLRPTRDVLASHHQLYSGKPPAAFPCGALSSGLSQQILFVSLLFFFHARLDYLLGGGLVGFILFNFFFFVPLRSRSLL